MHVNLLLIYMNNAEFNILRFNVNSSYLSKVLKIVIKLKRSVQNVQTFKTNLEQKGFDRLWGRGGG